MADFTVKGVVMRETVYKETDSVVTILSAERGIITAFARGVYKALSKNRPAVQLFCYSEFEIAENGGRSIIKSASLIEQFYNLRNDPEKYALACYIAETANFFGTSENDETELLRLVLNAYAALDVPGITVAKPLWLIKSAYELKLCCVCGFMPELYGCFACGRATDDEPKDENDSFSVRGKYTFSLSEGSLFCEKCVGRAISHEERTFFTRFSESVLLAARFIAGSAINRFTSFKLSEESAVELADFTEKYLLFVAERGFETLKYYKALTECLSED